MVFSCRNSTSPLYWKFLTCQYQWHINTMISVFGFTAFAPKVPFRRSAVIPGVVMTDGCAGSALGQDCFFARAMYPGEYACVKCRVPGATLPRSKTFNQVCIACFYEDEANKYNKCTRDGCLQALARRKDDEEKHNKVQAGKLPVVWGSMHSTSAASSHPSQTIQQALKDQAELKEKVKGMQEQIDELEELQEKVKGMQEQIDELAELKEKVKGMQEQIDELAELKDNVKTMQEQYQRDNGWQGWQPQQHGSWGATRKVD